MKQKNNLIKTLIILIVFLFVCIFSLNVKAQSIKISQNNNEIDIYVFTQESCKNCAKMKEYLNSLNLDYVSVHYYDYESAEYKDLYEKMKEVFVAKGTAFGFPFTIIGGKYYIGYNDYIAMSIRKYITIFSDESYSQKTPYHDIEVYYGDDEYDDDFNDDYDAFDDEYADYDFDDDYDDEYDDDYDAPTGNTRNLGKSAKKSKKGKKSDDYDVDFIDL